MGAVWFFISTHTIGNLLTNTSRSRQRLLLSSNHLEIGLLHKTRERLECSNVVLTVRTHDQVLWFK